MKIGVFGDSYAVAWDTKNPFWSNILRNDYGYTVENHGYGGTGLDYSYHKFMQTYDSYDKIIFVLSHPNRKALYEVDKEHWNWIPFREKLKYLKLKVATGMYDGWETVTKELSGKLDRSDKADAKAILDQFYKYPHADFLQYHAMIDSIHYRHDSVYCIPAFDVYEPHGLINISSLDWDAYGTRNEVSHLRFNHMSGEQNYQLAEYINQYLTSNDREAFLKTINTRTVGEYFKPTTSKEISGLV